MRVVVTGTREGRPDVRAWLQRFARKHGVPELLIVGDQCGVDAQALDFAIECLWSYARIAVRPMLPSPRRYHDRNQRMVDLAGPGDYCLGFPIAGSLGTYDCMNRAKQRGLTVVKLPDTRSRALSG